MAEKEVRIKVTTEADASQVEDLNSVLDQTSSKANETGEAIRSAFEEATSTVDELTTELANIEMGTSDADFEEISIQLEEAQNEAQQLGDALNSIDDTNINTASTDTNELSNSLSEASESATELSDSMGLIESTMYMDMANQIGALGDQAESMAQDMNNASITVGQLATQTGIAEPQMRALIADISNVTFPQSEAMMYVKSLDQIGVSSSNLGKSATDLDKINDAFGLGANTVNSLGQELSVLGVDMNNVSSSFNALAYANANTVGGMENYYTFLKKYDAQFNELGYNVDQASIIISAATQKYGGGRAALSGLSEALKNANGDTRALEQSLGIQAGTLDNASAVTGQYAGQLEELANEEMEHKTITERLGAVWEDLSLQFSPVLAPLGEFVGLIGQIGQTALAINSILTLAETFGLLETATISETIAQWGLNFSFLANPITWVVVAIIALIAVLVWAYYNVDWFREMVDNAWASLVQFAEQITGAVTGALQWLGDLFNNFTQELGLNTDNWAQAILGFILFLPQLPLRVGQILIDTIAKALGFGNNFTSTLFNAGVNAVNGFLQSIGRMAQALYEELQAMLKMAEDFAMRIADKLTFGGASMVTGWKYGSGENSPGYMYDAFTGELKAMTDIVPAYSNRLIGRVTGMGKGLNDGFDFNTDDLSTGNKLLVNAVTNGNNNSDIPVVQNFTFEGCTFDKEERVQEILDVFHNEIRWNNSTAGRTI